MSKTSDIFNRNLLLWKIFGIWSGRTPMKFYNYYTFIYLFINLFGYNVLLTANLIYTPLKIDAFIREVIFYFTEIVVTAKVMMIILQRENILKMFYLLDSEEFKGDDDGSSTIVENNKRIYTYVFNVYAIISNICYFSQVLAPVLVDLILGASTIELPICKYYFLSDESRKNYFAFWFIYQSIGMYGHMMYNVSCDSFIAGVLFMTETQMKVINFKLLHLNKKDECLKHDEDEDKHIMKFKKCLQHYHLLLKYCSAVQDFISVTMFIQFVIGSIIICVSLCALLLPSKTETVVFMVTYLMVMTSQIYMPGWLGTKINHESQKLVFAAYNTDWIPRSKPFKRNIMIFLVRANVPIQMTGMKMFPLSLVTFTSIMKTAYSLFTLIRNVQEPNM